jgi:peptidoglycan/LPS O-acetylase OafA/YrhL
VDGLAAHGGRPAVALPGGRVVAHRELAALADERAQRWGPGRRLVAVVGTPGPETLVAYVGALRARHATLLLPPDRAPALIEAYRPDVVVRGDDDEVHSATPAHDLHPDLALLLSTSGSTGSPKLVRLSWRNLAANAEAIAGYLPIRPTDRAALTLPLHYCYGLSVLHSNLLRGASVLLDPGSVADPGFWDRFRAHAATSLHGVPHTFDLLERAGFAELDLPHLRYATQAGGRWDPAAVRRWAGLAQRRGWDLYVMYGQTEATARMAYLPPERAAAAPSAVGVPVPGTTLHVDAPDARGVGELVCRGPGVMLGYAGEPADLARGREVAELRTGDLGRLRLDGLYEVTGRAARFVKPFGLRVDLDHAERLLAPAGVLACTGDDDGLVVAVAAGGRPERVRAAAAEQLGLPAPAVRVAEVAELPRTAAGKVDYAALPALVAPEPDTAPEVRAVFATVFPDRRVRGGDTFVGLGGDSLSSVRMQVGLTRVLGDLPPDWPTRTVRDLAARARTARGPARPVTTRLETATVLRAVAIVLVVGSHVGAFRLLGGSHVLLAVAGFAFARFALSPGAGDPARAALRSAVRIAVPSAAWIAWRASAQPDVELRHALLLNYWVDPQRWGYWFVETLVQILLLLALVLAVPAVARAQRRAPFAFACAALGLALAAVAVDDGGNTFTQRLMSPHVVLWLFVLGWLVQKAATPAQRLAATLLVVALVPAFFAGEPARGAVATVGVLLLLVPALRVPRLLVAPLTALAGASLTIYLTHYAVHPELGALPPAATTLACLVAGVAVHRLGGWALVRARSARVEAHRPAHLDADLAAGTRRVRVGGAAAHAGAADVEHDGGVVAVEDDLHHAPRPAAPRTREPQPQLLRAHQHAPRPVGRRHGVLAEHGRRAP